MPTPIGQPVQVLTWCDSLTGKMIPKVVRWERKDYLVKEVGLLHTFREGRDFVHVFTVNVGALDMLLHLYSVSRIWILVETTDEYYC